MCFSERAASVPIQIPWYCFVPLHVFFGKYFFDRVLDGSKHPLNTCVRLWSLCRNPPPLDPSIIHKHLYYTCHERPSFVRYNYSREAERIDDLGPDNAKNHHGGIARCNQGYVLFFQVFHPNHYRSASCLEHWKRTSEVELKYTKQPG